MLPIPTVHFEMLLNINENKNRLNSTFLGDLEKLKFLLRDILLPKSNFLDGELVTGEGNGESFFKILLLRLKIRHDSMLKRFNLKNWDGSSRKRKGNPRVTDRREICDSSFSGWDVPLPNNKRLPFPFLLTIS